MVERLGLRLWARLDQIVSDGPGRPRIGDHVAVRLDKEAPSFSPGFYMAFSDRGLDPDRPRLLDRYYFHVRPDSAVHCMELCTTRLNAAGLPFRVKVLDDPANFDRCDAAVLSMQRKDRAAAIDHVLELHKLLRGGLEAQVPALTLRLEQGLGFAEDPGDGASFGAHRCDIVAAALVEAHETGLAVPDHRMELVRSHMARAGTTPEAPYLGPRSPGHPRLARRAPLAREEASPCR
jgi:HopA1 effector protein family